MYVNDDLTIPKNPLNPATFFVDKDGKRHQPFNNFLQQATLLNDEGKMLAYGPNFEFEPNSVEIIQNGAIVDVRFNILNTGDADYTGDVTISSHAFENGLFRKLDSRPVTVAALRGTPAAVSYTITNFPASLVAANALQVRINEDDGAFPIPECTYSGNFSQELFGAPNYAFCGGEEATLFFYPQNSPHTYYWYNENPKDNPGAVSFRQGASHSFTKDATQAVERFFVRIYDDAGRDWLNDEVYPVSAFLVPDSLVWTGAVDSDWNDPDNWNYPNAPSSTCTECQAYRIPGSCTGVEIPGGKSRYPVLTSQDSPATVYAGYSCDRIRFGFGGEVKRTDSLQYREAFVDLTLKGNRWYLFSPPLRNFYTGDFYVSTPNSYVDGYFIEPMFFEANNPQTGTRTASATWTGRFNTPDIEAGIGSGMAVWVDKANTGYDNHDPVTFRFPKSDPFYYYYTDYGQQLDEHTPALDRTNGKRFVYEPNISAGGIVTWSIPDATNGQSYLIGNPFMAHLNFEAFADSNDTQILPQYKLAYGMASSAANGKVRGFVTRIKDGGGYVNTEPYEDGSVALTSHIAPMQAFVVTSRVDGTLSLRAFMADTEVNLAEPFSLRGAGDNLPERLLRISAFGEGHSGHALVLHRENGSHDYVPEEDSYSLFAGNDSVSVAVYTRSSDGYALDVNTIGRLDRGVSIGIRTVRRGEIRLKFTGTESFGSGVLVYLHDMLAGTVVCLSEGYEHVFGKTDGELYLDNRFFLTFSEVTDIRETPSEPDITVGQLPDGRVQVVSEGGRALGRVQVTGLQGNVILSQEHVESSCTFRAPAPGVYIVRVGTKVKKLVVSD